MAISQDDRLIRIATPLGDNAFVVLSFTGEENLSGLFSFNLELASEKSDITFEKLGGKNVTVSLKSADNSVRFFNGIIVAFSPVVISEKEGYSKYSAVMQPSFSLLSRCRDCRIFQDKNVPDIIRDVLGQGSLSPKGVKVKIDHRLELSGSYSPREYCVQYNETDLEFIDRLCETEGIYYFFEHENGKHTLVFADAPDKHKPHIAGAKETVTFQKTIGVALDREVITAMQQHKKLTTGSYTARDYNFTIPDTDLTVSRTAGPDGQGEWYEYPGGYEKTNNRGQTLAKVRMEACDVRFHILQGRSNVRGFRAGSRFILDKHPTTSLNGQSYVFTRIRHEAIQQLATGNSSGDSYTNFFSCFPHKVPFRPLRGTGKPLIVSSQTAIVTGTAYAHDQAAVHPTLACPPVCVVLEHW